jgi:hypothetical protein
MATAAGEQQRLTLGVAALLASALTILALRSIASSKNALSVQLPTADLESLSPYVRPLRDTSVLAVASAGAMVVTRDPFAPTGVARGGSPIKTTVNAPLPTTGNGLQQWVVSTILFEGSKKSAIVNNAWVTIGDTLGGGSRLTAVERDHIVVTDAKGIRHKVSIQGGETW